MDFRCVGIQLQETLCVAAQQLGLGMLRQVTLANKRTHSFFTQRERVVRTKHHSIGTDRSYQELQCALIEHGGIRVEPVQIMAGWIFAIAPRDWMVMPCVLQSSQ